MGNIYNINRCLLYLIVSLIYVLNLPLSLNYIWKHFEM